MYAIFKDELYEKAKEIYRQHLRFDAGDINNDQLYAHQNNRLREVIKYVADNSPFYREHLKGLTTTDIEKLTIDNIHTLPFTTKEDLRNHGPSLAAAPLHKSWIYYETTGTTGKPTPCPRNEIDSIHNNTPLIIHYRQIFACRQAFRRSRRRYMRRSGFMSIHVRRYGMPQADCNRPERWAFCRRQRAESNLANGQMSLKSRSTPRPEPYLNPWGLPPRI